MKLLQWSTIDLERGVGGVEVQARSLAREFSRLGVDCAFSSNPSDLTAKKLGSSGWGAVLYHGSAIPPLGFLLRSSGRAGVGRPLRIHMLHGCTLERMITCREWFFVGGYLAFFRELLGMVCADRVFSVNSTNLLYRWARSLGKQVVVCGNGWDSGDEGTGEALPAALESGLSQSSGFWLYIGRGEDPVKGADRLNDMILSGSRQTWVVVPGEGFKTQPGVLMSGQLSSTQVSRLLARARGLLVPSRYEGYPLVILEALAQGTPVVASDVGGIRAMSAELAGLVRVEDPTPQRLDSAAGDAEIRFPESERGVRAEKNRQKLQTWRQVAVVILAALGWSSSSDVC